MPEPARIELLGDHLDLAPAVADWHWRQWGRDGGLDSQITWTSTIARRLRTDEVPFTVIAFVGDDHVGSLSVCWDDADDQFAEVGPWLSGMFVLPPARNLGIGRHLLADAERRAVGMGHSELWAHTAEAEQFYARCGWEVVRPKVPLQRDAVVRRALAQPDAP
jgi:GNAT superfamily N-acetyltransferase